MLLVATAEDGTHGTLLTPGGDFDIVSSGDNSEHRYDSSNAISGSMAYKSVSGTTTGGGGNVGWSGSLGGAQNELWIRMYIAVPAFYSGSLCLLRNGTTSTARFSLSTNGTLRVLDGSAVTIGTSSAAVTENVPFRIEAHAIASASPTGGTLEMRIFLNKDSATPTETLGPYTSVETASSFSAVWFGPWGTGVPSLVVYHDDTAVSDSGWIGPSTFATSAWLGA